MHKLIDSSNWSNSTKGAATAMEIKVQKLSGKTFVQFSGILRRKERIMSGTSSNQDVNEMTDSLMIDLFKKIILEAKLDLQELSGSWEEASEFLRIHFGKLSRVMMNNQGTLHRLYQDSITELRKA